MTIKEQINGYQIEPSAAKRKNAQGKGINEALLFIFFFLSKQKHKPVTFTVGLFAGDLADMEGGESHKLSKLNYLLYLTNRAATQSRK